MTGDARRRAMELCAQIDIDGDGPGRYELLMQLCECLVDLARDGSDRECLEAWGDVQSFLQAAILSDLRRIGDVA